ncbi:hypothetical protein [Chromohalobacter canadensis]|uniref:Glycosyl transferase family 2 n=1 Tax=Chromohalobacter canadensis TaxID=141389 RepID=A0ABZ0YAV1_9GAMM|nr:hypothetical protein [Chromohalobacter canadensis]MCK0770241.1 hypothetical protein [Chromohalobacter canadensis]WQH08919.1 hypothetical protein SR908_15840 [Chromohalobacter canadensis]
MCDDRLLVYVFADKEYEIFVLPYIFFSLKYNKDAIVEVVLDDHDSPLLKSCRGVEVLYELYGDRFVIRKSQLTGRNYINLNARRFVEEPESVAKYIYIGDIDIMIMDDIKSKHLDLIKEHKIPFSNIIRNPEDSKKRLTGLHFSEYNKLYPLPDLSDLDLLRNNDEHLLYLIVSRKGYMVPADFRERPELGVHMSLSRDPLGRTSGPKQQTYQRKSIGWGGSGYYQEFQETITASDFKVLEDHLDVRFKLFVLILESIIKERFDDLAKFGLGYLVDRSAFIQSDMYKLKDVLKYNYGIEEMLAFPLRKEIKSSVK